MNESKVLEMALDYYSLVKEVKELRKNNKILLQAIVNIDDNCAPAGHSYNEIEYKMVCFARNAIKEVNQKSVK